MASLCVIGENVFWRNCHKKSRENKKPQQATIIKASFPSVEMVESGPNTATSELMDTSTVSDSTDTVESGIETCESAEMMYATNNNYYIHFNGVHNENIKDSYQSQPTKDTLDSDMEKQHRTKGSLPQYYETRQRGKGRSSLYEYY